MISVVDVFAGPGGLNEGFAQVQRGDAAFSMSWRLSRWSPMRWRRLVSAQRSPSTDGVGGRQALPAIP